MYVCANQKKRRNTTTEDMMKEKDFQLGLVLVDYEEVEQTRIGLNLSILASVNAILASILYWSLLLSLLFLLHEVHFFFTRHCSSSRIIIISQKYHP